MSLTEHLKDSGSPIRAYLDGLSPTLSGAKGGPRERLVTSHPTPATAAVLGDHDIRVRAALARNDSVPADVLVPLSEDHGSCQALPALDDLSPEQAQIRRPKPAGT